MNACWACANLKDKDVFWQMKCEPHPSHIDVTNMNPGVSERRYRFLPHPLIAVETEVNGPLDDCPRVDITQ